VNTPQTELSPARRELLRLLTGKAGQAEPLVPLPKGAPRPLSFVQERMWVSERFAGRPAGSTFTASARLKGPLDAGVLTLALGEIYRRHEVLRATFPSSDEPRQVVLDHVTPHIPLHDLSGIGSASRESALKEIIDREAAWRVDLGAWPLLRLRLVRLAEDDHVLLFSYHHIVADGWSTGLFYQELGTLYSAFAAGQPSPLAELEVQYPDYAGWQRRGVARPEFAEHLDYFKRSLSGNLPILELPTDRPRTASRNFSAGIHSFTMAGDLTRATKSLARAEGTTPFVTFLAAFLTLMSRCSGQEDLMVATPVANRTRREVESMIGCFMHPVVLRTDLSGDPTFRELLARVRAVWMEAFVHQDVPFELVMRAIRPQWDSVHMPVFQVLFNVQPATRGNLELPGVTVSDPELHVRSAALDLSVDMWISDDWIRGDVEYSADLFDEATVAWMMRSYVSLLGAVVSNPDQPISRIPMSGEATTSTAANSRALGLSEKRRELLRLLAGEPAAAPPAALPAEPARVGVHPCSFGQERLWFMDRLSPESAIYNQTQVVELQGPLDFDALRRAMDEIVRRHDILRTAVRSDVGRPVQVVEPELVVPLSYEDLSELSQAEQEARSRRRIDDQAHRAFDPAQPPLYRVTLLRLGPERHLMLETVHHLIADGWSMRVFRRELAAIYTAYTSGLSSPLPELPLQYADYARRQRTWYREAIVQGQMSYWRKQLAGELPVTKLPTDFPRPAGLSYARNVAQPFTLDGLNDELDRLRLESGATPFMVMLSAFLVLLHRYTGQEDLVVDTPVSGRTHSELEGLIGFFVNSLILRADLSGRPTFRRLLERVRKLCLEAYANQDLPFDKVVSQLQLPPERRGQPLTSVSFMLHETVAKNEDLGAGVRVVPADYDISDEFDLSLVVWQGPEGWSGDVQYDPRLFEPATAVRLAGHYTTLLNSALANPDLAIQDLTVLPEPELDRVLEEFNRSTLPAPSGLTLHGLFEARAEASPDTAAVVVPPATETADSEQSLSYSELNRRANRLARLLAEHGVGPKSRVGICMFRSTDMVAAVLAVLKAGAAYVPLDPAQGPARLRFMLEDSRCRVVLAHRGLLEDWNLSATILELELIEKQISRQDPSNLNTPLDGDQLAYVIYTSGSTGRPKGVMVTHRSLVNAYHAWEEAYGLKELTCHLQMANFSFDVFAGDLTRALGSGATLVLCPRESLLMPSELAELIDRYKVECAEFVPAVIRPLMEHLQKRERSLESLKLAIVGSDVWYVSEFQQLRRLLGGGTRVVNSYGVAEATIDSTLYDDPAHLPAEALVPIGKPFPGSRAYILDAYLNPVPLGAAGELYLAGRGLARGYADRPALTAERFVPDPFSPEPGGRLYRTGDRARHLSDGSIAFLGRVDNQIKIRGFRIEPGEIEAAIGRYSGVGASAVIVWEEGGRQRGLAAYVEASQEIVAAADAGGNNATNGEEAFLSDLRCHLREWLPDHMIPTWIVLVDALPLTPNGKLDRRALLAPAEAAGQTVSFDPPITEVQKQIAEIWSHLLGEVQVGLKDNFFDLGGHSLLLFEMQNRLRKAFGSEIPIVDLFRLTTVEELAGRVSGSEMQESSLSRVRDRVEKQQASLRRQRLRVTGLREEGTDSDD